MFGITFLNTAFLAGAIAAILPILIHLFSRQKVVTVDFSTIRFLRLSHRKRIRRLQIRQILLLILRILIILLCALALARPTLKGVFASGIAAQAKTTANIVIDHSFSMDALREDGALFSLARRRSMDITELLGEGDITYVTLMSNQPVDLFEEPTYNFERVQDEIRAASISHRTTNVKTTLTKVYQRLGESKNLNKELYFLTDLQAVGWDSMLANPITPDHENIRTYLIPITANDVENLAIRSVDYSNQLLRLGEPVVFRVQVMNYGQEDVSDRLIQLYIDGERKTQAGIDVKAGRTNTVSLSVTFNEEGVYSGYVEIADDVLATDNRYYFTITLQSSPRVLIVEEASVESQLNNAAFYVNVALQPEKDRDILARSTRINVKQLDRQNIDEFQTVVLVNVSTLDFTELAKLENFVERGGGLFIILGDQIDPQFYTRELLPKFMPVDLSATVGDENNKQAYISINQTDYDHPIFQVFTDKKNGDLSQAQFYKAFTLLPGPNTFVLSKFSNEIPFMVEGKKGKGGVIVMSSCPDMVWSNLPVKGIFLPLIHRTVQYLASGKVGEQTDYTVGSLITLQLSDIPLGQTVQVIDPSGQVTLVEPQVQKDNVQIEIANVELAGIYQVQVAEETYAKFAVNVDTKESQLTPLEKDVVMENLPHVRWVAEDESIEEAVTKTRYGRELWKEFLWIVLGLMIAEMFIARENPDRDEKDVA